MRWLLGCFKRQAEEVSGEAAGQQGNGGEPATYLASAPREPRRDRDRGSPSLLVPPSPAGPSSSVVVGPTAATSRKTGDKSLEQFVTGALVYNSSTSGPPASTWAPTGSSLTVSSANVVNRMMGTTHSTGGLVSIMASEGEHGGRLPSGLMGMPLSPMISLGYAR